MRRAVICICRRFMFRFGPSRGMIRGTTICRHHQPMLVSIALLNCARSGPDAWIAAARASPQKSTRSFDMIRELDRLGLPHLHPTPTSHSGSVSGMTPAAAASSISLATASSMNAMDSRAAAAGAASPDNPWASLHLHVLPLFNGEPLRFPIEDLNTLVRKHLRAVVSRSPSRAINMLEADVMELVKTGMLNLNAKLSNLDDEKLIPRVVEIWTFFWVQVLPYVEGVRGCFRNVLRLLDSILRPIGLPTLADRPTTRISRSHPEITPPIFSQRPRKEVAQPLRFNIKWPPHNRCSDPRPQILP